MERAVLLANHVISAEPIAMERLRRHSGSTLEVRFAGWPSLLPGPADGGACASPPRASSSGSARARVPPAALRIEVDASNPAMAFVQTLSGARPRVEVSGDAAFAADVDWLAENLRWDVEDDLARVVGQGPAHAVARVGRAAASGLRTAVRTLDGLVTKVAPGASGARGPDEARRQTPLHLSHGSAVRAGRAGAVALSPASGPPAGAGDDDRQAPGCAARRAPAAGAGTPRPDIRQVRPGPVDPARPAAGRYCRRAGPAAGPGAAVSGGASRAVWSSARSAGRSTRCSRASRPSRWPAPRSPRCTSRCCATGARSRSRCCARACWR